MNTQTAYTTINTTTSSVNSLGFYTAIMTTVLTVVTFVIAFLTPPLSGPGCQSSCFTYPFSGIVSRFPRDYWWMYLAILLSFIYIVLNVCIHYYAPQGKKIYSHIGLSFALISAAILSIDYFLQVSVIQPSLVNGETEGIALLTQFNSHGIFIALEELGFLMMSVAFLFMSPVFSGTNKLEAGVRWVFIIGFVLTISSLIFFTIQYGIFREYRFEITVISINWLVLIISGILLSIVFRRAMRIAQ